MGYPCYLFFFFFFFFFMYQFFFFKVKIRMGVFLLMSVDLILSVTFISIMLSLFPYFLYALHYPSHSPSFPIPFTILGIHYHLSSSPSPLFSSLFLPSHLIPLHLYPLTSPHTHHVYSLLPPPLFSSLSLFLFFFLFLFLLLLFSIFFLYNEYMYALYLFFTLF